MEDLKHVTLSKICTWVTKRFVTEKSRQGKLPIQIEHIHTQTTQNEGC